MMALLKLLGQVEGAVAKGASVVKGGVLRAGRALLPREERGRGSRARERLRSWVGRLGLH